MTGLLWFGEVGLLYAMVSCLLAMVVGRLLRANVALDVDGLDDEAMDLFEPLVAPPSRPLRPAIRARKASVVAQS